MIKLTNTITGKKEELQSKNITMYVCGVTPYDHAHVGHGRCYVSFDVLYRLLKFLGNDVTYCRNFTDIDDKLLHRAQKEFNDRMRYQEIANRYIESFNRDMTKLNCIKPDIEPRVTENIDTIISFIEQLIAKGHAYESNGDVYFSISTFPSYGKLSKQKIEELRAGARVDVREQKKDHLDFALWKSEPVGEFWDSPWGFGRPGWHIECSALAHHYLDEHIDIHGGGLDLIFPHHENEIAQSESLFGQPFARIWLHNGLVNVGKEKMSKSLGNIFSLQDLLEQYDPMVVRYFYLTHHYRAPLEFSIEALNNAQRSYEKLIRIFDGKTSEKIIRPDSAIIDRMHEFLTDDLNTPGLFGVLFENMNAIVKDEQEVCFVKNILEHVLGLTLVPIEKKTIQITPEIKQLIDERAQARIAKNWNRSDELRDQLEKLGIEVRDEKI